MAQSFPRIHRFLIQLLAIVMLGALCIGMSVISAGCDGLYFGANAGNAGNQNQAQGNNNNGGGAGGGLCAPCLLAADCGGGSDLCLANFEAHERFCARACDVQDCPSGYQCANLAGEGQPQVLQCVPEGATCGLTPAGCDPACDGEADLDCYNGDCYRAGAYLAERALCVELVNAYREQLALPALIADPALEDCARESAEVDGETGVSMGHFDTTGGCGFVAAAQTQVPGWALSRYGTVDAIVDYGIGTQVAAGEGDPDYETVAGEFEAVGCGVYVTGSNEAWVVLSFR